MVIFVVFLNLFFVPAVALWIHKKRRKEEIIPSLKLLMQYAIFTSCNVPLTKVGIFCIRNLVHWNISMDSGYYTFLAIIAAAMLPGLLDWVRATNANRDVLLKKGKIFLTRRTMKYRQKLAVMLLLVLLIVVAYVIRGPLEIYAANAHELLFILSDFLPWMLAIGAAVLVVASALLALLPDELFRLTTIPLLWFGIASWAQDLFWNKKLVESNGGPVDWNALGSLPRKNLIAWILLLIFLVFIFIKFGHSWLSITKVTAAALCLVQIIACGAVFLSLPEKEKPEQYVSGEDQMKLASDENVIVLLLDHTGMGALKSMEEQYPKAANILKDFTCYENACCNYYGTFPSVTHYFTGYDLEFGITGLEWARRAWNSERCNRFFQYLKEEGFESRIFHDSVSYTFGGVENLIGKIENIRSVTMEVDRESLISKLLTFSAYRFVPYVYKPEFEVLTSEFGDIVAPIDVPLCAAQNFDFYKRLKEEKLSIDLEQKKLFIYEHLMGAHPVYATDVNVNYVPAGTTETETIRGCFTLLEEYFTQLKELGLYDGAAIIVMSDHGNLITDDLAPIFYLKKPGETHEQSPISTAPIEHGDFQATVMELIGRNDGSFGTSVFDWGPNDERRRVLWVQMLDETAPPVQGNTVNVAKQYIYYRDTEELMEHYFNDAPDSIETPNPWLEGSVMSFAVKR